MDGLKVGISGWQRLQSYYPPRTRSADMLAYYSQHFSLVETSTTFQGIPNPGRVREWAESVPSDFTFDVVAFGGLTLHQRRPGASAGEEKSGWEDISVEPPEVLIDAFDVYAIKLDKRIRTAIAESRSLETAREYLIPKLLSGVPRI